MSSPQGSKQLFRGDAYLNKLLKTFLSIEIKLENKIEILDGKNSSKKCCLGN